MQVKARGHSVWDNETDEPAILHWPLSLKTKYIQKSKRNHTDVREIAEKYYLFKKKA